MYKGEAYSAEFIRRPELNLFAAQNQQLEAQRKQLTAKNLPRLGIFVQGAYGNPGLNMLKNEFSAYYVAAYAFPGTSVTYILARMNLAN